MYTYLTSFLIGIGSDYFAGYRYILFITVVICDNLSHQELIKEHNYNGAI